MGYANVPATGLDLTVHSLGPRKVRSPYRVSLYASDDEITLYDASRRLSEEDVTADAAANRVGFELAGPRREIYFDPVKTRCGIVTCGGLCPGLNGVIQAIVLQLHHHYGVRTIHGFRYGYEGLVASGGHPTKQLTPKAVSNIHLLGGSILSSSRGPQDSAEMVDALERLNIQVLFCLGGDGTLRGALDIHREIERRGLKIAVVGVPKTIDNDILLTERSFGFETAYSMAADAIRGAHVEAKGAPYGIGLVKLMGRHSGFIAAHAALASRDVNFVLIPEVDFDLGGSNGLLVHLHRRLRARHHAVVVVAEGAGQGLFEDGGDAAETDASGNARLKDIGVLLKGSISQYLKLMEVPFNLKYIDPSYLIRSAPATPNDTLFAGLHGQMAAHAAMAGKTAVMIGYWNGHFTHVPIAAAVSRRKTLDPTHNFWQSVIECTGQPRSMINDGSQVDFDDEALIGSGKDDSRAGVLQSGPW